MLDFACYLQLIQSNALDSIWFTLKVRQKLLSIVIGIFFKQLKMLFWSSCLIQYFSVEVWDKLCQKCPPLSYKFYTPYGTIAYILQYNEDEDVFICGSLLDR